MAKNERKRQKQLAAKKKKRQQKKSTIQGLTLSESRFSLKSTEQAESYPIRDCFMPEHLFFRGMGTVVITRDLPNGNVAVGSFLLDTYCLGIKDAFLRSFNIFDYREFIEALEMSESLEKIEASYARKLIEDSAAYADNLGFRPHKDYKKARLMFGAIDSSECTKTFEFGKDGKPYFMSGPFDSTGKIEKIRRTLTKSCGEDGFNFMLVDGDDILDFDVLEE